MIKNLIVAVAVLITGVAGYIVLSSGVFGAAGNCESFTCFTKLRVTEALAIDGTTTNPSCVEFNATSTATTLKLVFVSSSTPTTAVYLGATYGTCS